MSRASRHRRRAVHKPQPRLIDEPPAKQEKRRRRRKLWSLVLIVLPLLLSLVIPRSTHIEGSRSHPTTWVTGSILPSVSAPDRVPTELTAIVRMTHSQIAVTNADSVGWRNVVIGINVVRHWGEGFLFRSPQLDPGETLTAGVMEFARYDGIRFNPSKARLKTLSIVCDLPDGRGQWTTPQHIGGQ